MFKIRKLCWFGVKVWLSFQ